MRKKLKMNYTEVITFEKGCEKYINNYKAKNLREVTLSLVNIKIRDLDFDN